ncbi:MAG: phosphoribosylanthranilate isomerase [Clostridiales bacterium]|nr:phosphoribosylanthranilate isomerase [Clostridiales bacterium]
MTRIKMCGLSREVDIRKANELKPEYIGFVFWERSSRNVSYEKARELKALLDPSIRAVGVFVDEDFLKVKKLLDDGIIDIAQLHGSEDEDYILNLQKETSKKVIKAYKIRSEEDIEVANNSAADYILLDSGMGTGKVFDWSLLQRVERPYFLAGGLNPGNVSEAIRKLHPYAVDVSSGIETDGVKDTDKMAAFAAAVRKEDEI